MARNLKEVVKMFKGIRDDLPSFYDDVLKEEGLRFLSLVIPLTPVEENHIDAQGNAVRGGALRRSWIAEVEAGPTPSPTEIESYVKSLRTDGYKITLANTSSYAMYVNYGHLQQPGRYVPALGKRLVNYWVPGFKFKEKAEDEIRPYLSKVYDKVLKEHYKKWNKR